MIKFVTSVVVLSMISIGCTSSAIAKPNSHQVGFVTSIKQSRFMQMGVYAYSLVGKNKSNFVLVHIDGSTLMNIDGKDIQLNTIKNRRIDRKGKFIQSMDTYQSGAFKMTTNILNVTTEKDRKNFTARERGSIVITNNDGWKKKIEVECAYDTGG